MGFPKPMELLALVSFCELFGEPRSPHWGWPAQAGCVTVSNCLNKRPGGKKLSVRDSEFLVNTKEICRPRLDGRLHREQGTKGFLGSSALSAPGGSWLHCFTVTAELGRETRDIASRLHCCNLILLQGPLCRLLQLELLFRVLRMLILSQLPVSSSFQKRTLTSFTNSSCHSFH